MNKLMKVIVFVMVLVFVICSFISVMSAYAETCNIKMATLTTDQGSMLTDIQYKELVKNVTDIVLIPNKVTTGEDESEYIKVLAPKVIDLINKLYNAKGSIKIWLGTPCPTDKYLVNNPDRAKIIYEYITFIRDQIGPEKWENINIYMNHESIFGRIGISVYQHEVNGFNYERNIYITLMSDLSKKIHEELGKKFLWIPYYGYGVNTETVIKKVAAVADLSIFDYLLIQPHYYFDNSCKSALNGVYESVVRQKVCFDDGKIVYRPESSFLKNGSKTIIGFEMESSLILIYPKNANYSEYKLRYDDYVSKFEKIKDEYPSAFYWSFSFDSKDSTKNDSINVIRKIIQPFYSSK